MIVQVIFFFSNICNLTSRQHMNVTCFSSTEHAGAPEWKNQILLIYFYFLQFAYSWKKFMRFELIDEKNMQYSKCEDSLMFWHTIITKTHQTVPNLYSTQDQNKERLQCLYIRRYALSVWLPRTQRVLRAHVTECWRQSKTWIFMSWHKNWRHHY